MYAWSTDMGGNAPPAGTRFPGLVPAVLLFAILCLPPGCAGPERTMVLDLQPGQKAEFSGRVWPVPPDVPRYRYIGELVGEQNFKVVEEAGSPDRSKLSRWVSGFWQWLTGLGEKRPNMVVLQRPQSGVTDADGRVYVTDVSRQAVFVFDPVQGELRLWEFADGRRRFLAPIGIAFDDAKRFFVTDAELGEVFRFDAEGTHLDSFGKDILRRPTGIVFDAEQQHLYVADTEANDIKVFDTEGRLLDTLGFSGDEAGRLNRPVYLAFAQGRLFVSDSLNARVQIFDRAGNSASTIGRRGLYVGNLTRPKGVAVDREGHIYVIEGFYDHMLVFQRDGQFLMAIGGTGQREGQFYLPAGVWTDSGNRVYVADMFNGRVSIFQFLGGEE